MFLVTELNLTQSHITVECAQCGHIYTFIATAGGISKWRRGELIQIALPELRKDQRELMISGICGDCFNKLFPPES